MTTSNMKGEASQSLTIVFNNRIKPVGISPHSLRVCLLSADVLEHALLCVAEILRQHL